MGENASPVPAERAKRLGLALSGGSARGGAHAGVFRVLQRERIHPACIAGTSSGAIVGAFYAAGVSIEDQLEFSQRLRWRSLKMLGMPKLGFFQPGEMERYLRGVIGDVSFRDLSVPLAVMATEFRTARSVVFREGPVAWALSASAAIPVVFSPVQDGDRVLVDGGLTDNLPSQVCRVMGADVVLAVNCLPRFGPDRSYRNLFDIAMATFDLLALPSTDRGSRAADLTAYPEVLDIHPSDLHRMPEIVTRGERAMEAVLPELKRLLDLEPESETRSA